MDPMRWKILVNSAAAALGGGLTYEAGEASLKPGLLVLVPLRGGVAEGIVLESEETVSTEHTIKQVRAVLHPDPLLTAAQLKTIVWVSAYYLCDLRTAAGPFLPSGRWRDLLPPVRINYRLNAIDEKKKLGAIQKRVVDALRTHSELSQQALLSAAQCKPADLKKLVESGMLLQSESHDRHSQAVRITTAKTALTSAQSVSLSDLQEAKKPVLLFGITGSGKTEVYAQAVERCIRDGKQAIVLVPEILLTEHIVGRFEDMLGREQIAVLHSKLTPSEKKREWLRVRTGEAALVIGSRSALFAPCEKLGLVVVDEEHEWTYKNEQAPRYHVRETAEQLCKDSDAKLMFGSATPSLEAWDKAKTGAYILSRLPERFGGAMLPTVRVIDLKDAYFGKHYPFTSALLEAIDQRLQKHEQSVLFLNRRGMASAMMCLECRQRLTSPSSQLPYTVHQDSMGRPYLLDHFTNQRSDVPATCPNCKSAELLAVGAGTVRIEEQLASLFPKARLLRADSDTLKSPEDMRFILDTMKQGEADILLGTQSVVKGLDLPGVTLAAVLIADIGMSLPHFRAGERVFQLLTQLTGRSGRRVPGEVIIQTFRPQAAEVVAASTHQTEAFLDAESALRTKLRYPPAVSLIRIIIRGADASVRALRIADELKKKGFGTDAVISAAASLYGGGAVWHVLIRGSDPASLLPGTDLGDVSVDRDPMELL